MTTVYYSAMKYRDQRHQLLESEGVEISNGKGVTLYNPGTLPDTIDHRAIPETSSEGLFWDTARLLDDRERQVSNGEGVTMYNPGTRPENIDHPAIAETSSEGPLLDDPERRGATLQWLLDDREALRRQVAAQQRALYHLENS